MGLLKASFEGITERDGTYQIADGVALYAKELIAENASDGTALFIHGAEGNHTIIRRPAYFLINKGYFARIIMPDRRGTGNSSPITSFMDIEDNAFDLKRLLDKMGVNEKLTAIGMSLGGSIALKLASLDQRVEKVILIASSPLIKPNNYLFNLFYRSGIEEKVSRVIYFFFMGRRPTQYPDYDAAYNAKGLLGLLWVFYTELLHTKKSQMKSKVYEKMATRQLANAGMDDDLKITIPVIQVIGTRDKTWEIDMKDRYDRQIPHITVKHIKNASHMDILLKASLFYNGLGELLTDRRRSGSMTEIAP